MPIYIKYKDHKFMNSDLCLMKYLDGTDKKSISDCKKNQQKKLMEDTNALDTQLMYSQGGQEEQIVYV